MRHVASQLAAFGRNGDTTLVHMSEGEVHGLRALARRNGTDLTTNPHTGLPEAFNLASLLPMAVGFIPGLGPMASMALGAGLGALTSKGNPLMGALSGGMGAYSGMNLASTLSGAGADVIAKEAMQQGAGAAMSAPTADMAAAGTQAANAAAQAVPTQQLGIGAAENPSLYSSAASNAAGVPNPMDQMRAYEHGYQNAVTGGSDAWSDARLAAGQAPQMQQIAAGVRDPSALLTKDGVKKVGFPMYAALSLSPMLQSATKRPGGDNGNQYDGELFFDQSTFVPGMPEGIQRSRAVQRRAQGGLTSLGSFGGAPQMSPIALTAAQQILNPVRPPARMQGPAPMPFQPYVSPYAGLPQAPVQPIQRFSQEQQDAVSGLKTIQPTNPFAKGLRPWEQAETGGAAAGGPVGQYLQGPGDGMSDDIPATVHDTGEGIRVAANEFVVPADVVSHLGNGSSDAGAKVLEEMGRRVRHARTGNPEQGKRIYAKKFLPA